MSLQIQTSIQSHAIIILPNTDGIELLVCYEDEGVYVNTYGRITKDVVLQWGEMPTSVGESQRQKLHKDTPYSFSSYIYLDQSFPALVTHNSLKSSVYLQPLIMSSHHILSVSCEQFHQRVIIPSLKLLHLSDIYRPENVNVNKSEKRKILLFS